MQPFCVVAHDAQPMLDFPLEPPPALLMLYVIPIEKGQEETDVQQRAHEEVTPD